ncbi:hypothetical protein NE235_13495 [Actinoallomurus spadix]|uniref:Uncharacterized protein n=1 Tax=Actinoallomurus spadix TaxID=79912 RepID=A0ABP3G329_9ACTN|nr:hypothetical protein [Actinoallomurus spadix]MCO5987114.1 hypothetical protein [Actinoallomurus spadix]
MSTERDGVQEPSPEQPGKPEGIEHAGSPEEARPSAPGEGPAQTPPSDPPEPSPQDAGSVPGEQVAPLPEASQPGQSGSGESGSGESGSGEPAQAGGAAAGAAEAPAPGWTPSSSPHAGPGGPGAPDGPAGPGADPGGSGPYPQHPGGPAPYPGGPAGPGPFPGGPTGPGPYGDPTATPGPYGDATPAPGSYGDATAPPGPYGDAAGAPGPYAGGPAGPGPYGQQAGGPGPYAGNPAGPGPWENPSGPVGPTAGPQGWGGGQGWGAPQPYGFGPPPRAKKSKGVLISVLAGAGVVLVVLAVVGVVALGRSGDDDPKTTSGKAAREAGRRIGQAAGLTLTGTYGGNQATFGVTKAGSARGTFTASGSQVGRVDVGGTTYLKANSGFWNDQGLTSADAQKAGDNWTKAPDDLTTLSLADLAPSRLGSVLAQAANDPLAVRTTVGGVQAVKMRVAARTYYITKSEPRRVLRLEGVSGSDRYVFDVKPLTSATAGEVFNGLRTDVRALKDAYDPDLTVVPAGKLQFGSCTESGCTVHADVRATTLHDTDGGVRVTMKISFSATTYGSSVSTCSDTASAKLDSQVRLSCRTSGGKWSSWYRSHVGRFTIHATPSFSGTVNTAADVNGLLDKLAEEQRTS